MMPDIIANVVNIISIFFIRMILTAVITAPLIIFSAAVSRCMKAPRRYAYRMWCMTGAAVFLLIAGSAVSMLPSGVLSQFNEGAASYTDVQNTDLPEPIQGNTVRCIGIASFGIKNFGISRCYGKLGIRWQIKCDCIRLRWISGITCYT